MAVFLRALFSVLFFAFGVMTAMLSERLLFSNPSEEKVTVALEDETEAEEPVPTVLKGLREVGLKWIETGNYISEGDLIDIRVVNREGVDEKLLAENNITGLDRDGLTLLVGEDELTLITSAYLKKEEGSIVRAYAVRIP